MPTYFFHLQINIDSLHSPEVAHEPAWASRHWPPSSRVAHASGSRQLTPLEPEKAEERDERQQKGPHSQPAAVSAPPEQPLSPSSAAGNPQPSRCDWRFSFLRTLSFDAASVTVALAGESGPKMLPHGAEEDSLLHRRPAPDVGPNLSRLGNATKARFAPLEVAGSDVGWGVVHLFREGDESADEEMGDEDNNDETQCTTLCIPAVPAEYDIPKFLDWVGPQWIPHVAHWRMVMTCHSGWYIALLKFRDAKRAKLFRDQCDGRLFPDVMRVAHVVYIRSVIYRPKQGSAFPDVTHDPFISSTYKPYPVPTADLVELPTCPVCLERMDDTSGLVTIHCQHIFHCNCLQRWKGSGCPVCRYTNRGSDSDTASSAASDSLNPYSRPFGSGGAENMCPTCDCTDDLWICLICGRVGCGRYKGGHAKQHYMDTAHCFALELQTQHVWDYAADKWVHRLLRNKSDGKVMELPSGGLSSASGPTSTCAGYEDETAGPGARQSADLVPRSKIEAVGLEYTHLLSSHLDSQRVYFEAMLNKAVDKASQALVSADQSKEEVKALRAEIQKLRGSNERLGSVVVPQLERDVERERRRSEKSSELARNLSRTLQDEKKVSEGLLERVRHLTHELDDLRSSLEKVMVEKGELEDMNRDLSMFISGQDRLRQLESAGQVEEEEVRDGTISVPTQQPPAGESSSGGRRRRNGKGRGGTS